MRYTSAQLHELILPMLKSMGENYNSVADVIVRLIEEDREDIARRIEVILDSTARGLGSEVTNDETR